MSWAKDEWKEGLSQRVILKITDIESANEKLIKECKQKSFQIDALEGALYKQVNTDYRG